MMHVFIYCSFHYLLCQDSSSLFYILYNNEGQGTLACCNPWGRKQLDMTEQLNNILVLKGVFASWILEVSY